MVLTFALGPHVKVVRIIALGERRGPAPEARTLYEEIDSP
jgi:ribosome-associated heat shock protein Hsp15